MCSFCTFQDQKSGILILILDPNKKTDLLPMSAFRIPTVNHKCKIFKCEQSFFKVGHNFRFKAQKKKAQRVEKKFLFWILLEKRSKKLWNIFCQFLLEQKITFLRLVKRTEKRWPNQTCKHDRILTPKHVLWLKSSEALKLFEKCHVYSPLIRSSYKGFLSSLFSHVYRSDSVIFFRSS